MIALILACAAAVAAAAVALEKSVNNDLRRENESLRRQLATTRERERKAHTANEARLMADIGKLQMAVYTRDEIIGTLRTQLARKNQIINQKWQDARGE